MRFLVRIFTDDGNCRNIGNVTLISKIDNVYTLEDAERYARKHLCGEGQYAVVIPLTKIIPLNCRGRYEGSD